MAIITTFPYHILKHHKKLVFNYVHINLSNIRYI